MSLETSASPPADPDGELGPGTDPGAEPADQREQPRRKRGGHKKQRAAKGSGADKQPRPRASSGSTSAGAKPLAGAAQKAQSKRIEEKLAELLTFPAVPATMFGADAQTKLYMMEHFSRSGPKTAHELVEASEQFPELRAMLERAVFGASWFGVAMVAVAYVAPPVMWTLGMRAQAAGMTQASTMTEADVIAMREAMMAAERDAAAQAANQQGAPSPDHQGAQDWPAEAGAGPIHE